MTLNMEMVAEAVDFWVASEEDFKDWQNRFGSIYVLKAGNTDRLKIGYTRDITSRLRTLQTGSPEELKVVCHMAGPQFAERAIHITYQGLCVRGEWYRDDGEILGWLSDISKGHLIGRLVWGLRGVTH